MTTTGGAHPPQHGPDDQRPSGATAPPEPGSRSGSPDPTPDLTPDAAPDAAPESGPAPVPETGPQPVSETGPQPVSETAPYPVPETGPQPLPATGPHPVADPEPAPGSGQGGTGDNTVWIAPSQAAPETAPWGMPAVDAPPPPADARAWGPPTPPAPWDPAPPPPGPAGQSWPAGPGAGQSPWAGPTSVQPAGSWQPPAPGQQPRPGQQPWSDPGPAALPAGLPSRNRTTTVVAMIAVGALVLAGLGVAGYLLLKPSGTAAAGPMTPIQTPTLSYTVPTDWTQGGEPLTNPFGLAFAGVARGPEYECAGRSFVRGIVASAVLPGTVSLTSLPALAQGLAQAFYTPPEGSRPDVSASNAQTVDVGGIQGNLVEATARTATDDGCLATEGTVLVLAVPTSGPDGRPAMALLVVNGDDAGGPPDAPPSPSRAALDAIVASARPATI